LEEEGAARVVLNSEATAERLGNEISDLINQQGRLEDMAQAATRLGRPHAADEVARDFLELADILP
ncbi:MAG: hypothetical protein MK135_09975, partial [Polyangiaceae bacterium]|nr:hypothetical protein [Polyangiaceae bacterium]